MRLHRRACSKTTGVILPRKAAIRAVLVASFIGSTAGVSLGQLDRDVGRDVGAGPASPWSKPFPSPRLASLPSASNALQTTLTPTTQTPTTQTPTTQTPTTQTLSNSEGSAPSLPANPNATQPRKLAAVSMLGPIPANSGEAAPKISSANRNAMSGDRIASANDRSLLSSSQQSGQQTSQQSNSIPSRHASTQLSSIDSSVDWNRVPEGGLILEMGDQEVLEERSLALARSAVQPTSPRRRILQGLPEREFEELGVDSQMVSNSSMSRNSAPSLDRRSRNTLEIGSPAVEVALEPVIDAEVVGNADASNALEPDASGRINQGAGSTSGRERGPVDSSPRYPHDSFSEGLYLDDSNPIAINAAPLPSVQSQVPSTSLPRVEVRRPGEWTSSTGERLALAQRISQETLSSRDQIGMSPEPIEPPVGWSSIEVELRRCLENCDQLLRRNAVFSARDEAMQGLRTLVRAVDTHRKQWTCEKALQQAMVAMKECTDFEESVLLDAKQLRLIINNHTTPVLKDKDIAVMSPTVAGQHYRAFAKQSFLIATDGHPWGADLLYALGKTYEREAEQDVPRGIMLRNQATVCFQAASMLGPTRSHIANQLGFNLLQLDRIDEAYQALKSSLESQPSANAWRNLAEVYRRRGAVESVNYALAQAESLSAGESPAGPRTPEIMEVSPEEFARYSPPPVMASSQTAGASAANPAGAYATQGGNSGLSSATTAPNGPVTVSSKGWFPKVFR